MTTAFSGALNSAVALPVITSERAVFYRERTSRTYHALSYSLSLWIVEIPFTAYGILWFALPFYYLMDMLSSSQEFMKYYFMLLLVGWTINSLGHFLAAVLPNLIVATQIQGLCFNLIFQFGGVFIRKAGTGGLAKGWWWIYYINPVPKALNSIAMAQFACRVKGTSAEQIAAGCPSVTVGGGQPTAISFYLATEYLDAWQGGSYYAEQVGWLILSWVILRMFTILSLQYISYLKR